MLVCLQKGGQHNEEDNTLTPPPPLAHIHSHQTPANNREMNSYEHPFDKAADDAMFAAYMSSEFFELPSEETDSTDSGITHSAVVSDDDPQATVQVCLFEVGCDTPLIITGPEHRAQHRNQP